MEKHQNIARVRDDEELKRKAARALQEIGMHVLSQSPFLLVQASKESSPDGKYIDKTCHVKSVLFCSFQVLLLTKFLVAFFRSSFRREGDLLAL